MIIKRIIQSIMIIGKMDLGEIKEKVEVEAEASIMNMKEESIITLIKITITSNKETMKKMAKLKYITKETTITIKIITIEMRLLN